MASPEAATAMQQQSASVKPTLSADAEADNKDLKQALSMNNVKVEVGSSAPSPPDVEVAAEESMAPPMSTTPSFWARQRARMREGEMQQFVSFLVVLMIVSTDFMGFSILNPLTPFYVEAFDDAKEMGVGTAVALMTSSYAFTQLVATPLMGFASARWGRKPLFLVSLTGSFLGFLGQGFATSFRMLILLRFFTGIFAGSRPVALQYIGDTVPPAKQPRYIAGLASAVSMSLFAAPVFGGSLGLVALWLPCFFQAGLCALAIPVTYWYLLEPQSQLKDPQQQVAGEGRTSGAWKGWLSVNALAGFVSMLGMMSWGTIVPIVASMKHGLDQNSVGLIMGSSALLIGLGNILIFAPASKHVKIPVLALVGGLLLGTAALLPVFDSLEALIVLCCVQAVGATLVVPGLSITVNVLAPAEARASATAATVTMQAVARVIGPVLAGALYDEADWAPSVVVGIMAAVLVLLEMALATRMPSLKQLAASQAQQEIGAAEKSKEAADVESVSQPLRPARTVQADLLASLARAQEKLRNQECTDTTLPPAEVGLEDRHAFGVWATEMLEAHNYKRWKANEDSIKALMRNAFPPVRDGPSKLEDVVFVLEAHLNLHDHWEQDDVHLDLDRAMYY